MTQRKVVVTGGEGFIGSNLIESLVRQGFEVHSVDNRIREERRISGAIYHTEDVRDHTAMSQVFARADAVFHMAAIASVQYCEEHPAETDDINRVGTQVVLSAARDAKVRRVIFSSSSAVYGMLVPPHRESTIVPEPISQYAMHKFAGEGLMREFSNDDLETVSLRYFNVYGPRMDPHGAYAAVIGIFLAQKKQNKPLVICGDGLQTRDFVHVYDVVAANIAAMDSSHVGKGEVINIGTGVPVAINGLAALIAGSTHPTEYVDTRPGEVRFSSADISAAYQLLSWEPEVGIQSGIGMVKREWGL